MPAFFSNFYVGVVATAPGDKIHTVLQNTTINDLRVILIDFDFNANIPTFEARRFTAAATLTPLAIPRPMIGCLDDTSALPGAVVATVESDTISPNGTTDLAPRVFDVTTQRSLYTPLSIIVPAGTCLAVYTVDQVGARNVFFRLAWTEPRA